MPAARLDRETAAAYAGRFEALSPEAAPQWGTMSPVQMVAHLRRTVEISLGEHAVPDQSNVLTRTLGRWIAFHLMPRWPGGVIKAPAGYSAEPGGDLDAERWALRDAIDRFTDAAEREPNRTALSPLFGPMPLRYWRRVHGMHFEHHLRQFNG